MKIPHGLTSLRFCFAILWLGVLPVAACDQSNSVGKIGKTGAGGSGADGRDGGVSSPGGSTASGVSGTAAGGTTAPASGGISGGAGKAGQAGASASGKAGALGSSAVDAGVDRYQCPLTNIYCPDGTTTDAYGCTVCVYPGTGGSAAGGTGAKGGAGGSRGDAAVDGHVCPPITDVYCTNYITDAYGCTVCAFGGTGGGAGGVTNKGGTSGSGTGGAGGTSGAAGSSGSGKTCQRVTNDDTICRSRNYPPLAYFCEVPAKPATSGCVAYNGIDSGDFVCCPEQYLACPDGPPTNGTACTGSAACTYGRHPDPTCRTSATCTNGTWQVRVSPTRCSEALLPSSCPASPTAGSACTPRGLSCAYADGTYCTCSNCTVEDNLCNASTADTWRCWSPPGGDCPTYYPNLGTTCALPANISCRYTCASITTCSATGAWAAGPNRCPN